MLLSVRLLEEPPSFCFVNSVAPGTSHLSTGVPITPEASEIEQVIVTEPPARMGEEGEEARVMLTRSVRREIFTHSD